ncbi:tRNA-dihydrouridine(20) synthase [NAD(P)+]-like [Penaeus indicus]|uniref:tRNA-dihydrouridine(20) synthase [NAD(P)+]-like n=1 Tax=Penaeus indicus TaxID=29960 RepID=UPI00300D7E90
MNQYKNAIIVAPMVRVCTLPFRLLAIDYGVDLIYTEETIDFKMLRSVRKDNEALGTTDFVDKSDGTVFFRTCEKERKKVVFQIGTNDPQRALKVGKMVEPYVAALDVNMGCPKEFSIKGGMGAALLTQPEKVKSILTTLVQGLSIPVTCKIRLLNNMEDTLALCRTIEQCGVAALAVHGRTKEERPNHPNHNDQIREIAKALSIPVIANGGSKEISCYEDIEKFRQETGAASVMIARAAMWNCSILRPEGYLPMDTVISSYLKYCTDYDNPFTYSKYTVQNMLRDQQDTLRGKAFLETQTLQEICVIWGLGEYYKTEQAKQARLRLALNVERESGKVSMPPSADHVSIVEKVEEGQKVVEMPVQFIRGNYNNADLPKMLLNTYIYRNQLSGPKYSHIVYDKFFAASVVVDGIKYRSTLKEKSRRYSEQGAAMVCLHARGVVNKTYGFVPADGARKYQYVIDEANKAREKGEKRESESAENDKVEETSNNGDSGVVEHKKCKLENAVLTENSIIVNSGITADVADCNIKAS